MGGLKELVRGAEGEGVRRGEGEVVSTGRLEMLENVEIVERVMSNPVVIDHVLSFSCSDWLKAICHLNLAVDATPALIGRWEFRGCVVLHRSSIPANNPIEN